MCAHTLNVLFYTLWGALFDQAKLVRYCEQRGIQFDTPSTECHHESRINDRFGQRLHVSLIKSSS